MRREQTTPLVHSPTRTRFIELKREARKARKDAKEYGERVFFCEGLRETRGSLEPCRFEVWPMTKRVLTAKCRRCGTLHEKVDGKWLTVMQAEVKRKRDDSDYVSAHDGTYGMATPKHESWCGYKDFDLTGLRKTTRKMTIGKGRIGEGVCHIDYKGRPSHWCRKAK